MGDLTEVVNDLRKRIYDLERDQRRGSDTITVVGSCLGVAIPDTNAITNPCRPRTSATFHEACIELDAAAATDVTFEYLKSGTTIGSLTVPTGEIEATGAMEIGFSRGDTFQVKAVAPGSGYTSFTSHLVWHTTRDWWHPPVLMFGGAVEQSFPNDIDQGESGWKGTTSFDVDIPAGSHTFAVTYSSPFGSFITVAWSMTGPDGPGVPSAIDGPVSSPDTLSSTDTYTGGTYTVTLSTWTGSTSTTSYTFLLT